MNAVVASPIERIDAPVSAFAPARVALLGTGNVGQALLSRLASWDGSALGQRLSLHYVANTRQAFLPSSDVALWREAIRPTAASGRGGSADDAIAALESLAPTHLAAEGVDQVASALGHGATRILIDATASDEIAERHAGWLAQGIHVVTACKLGQGTCLGRWRAIRAACIDGRARYGDSATVGAGLPLLRTIRELRAGGDRIHGIAGRLSGSLAWLLSRYDGRLPFSAFVREARAAGYTEPDPREDLSGEDVRRKLLILVRAAGIELQAGDVAVVSLLPPELSPLSTDDVDDDDDDDVDAGWSQLDATMHDRYIRVSKRGERLHFIARFMHGRAQVGLESLAGDDPLAGGAGTDNRLAIWSDRYRDQPLVVQGPGAGAGVTAAALLDDALSIQAGALK